VYENGANAGDFGGSKGAKNSIPQKRLPESMALKPRCDREPADNDDGHGIGHVSLDPSRRARVRYGAGRKSIVSGELISR